MVLLTAGRRGSEQPLELVVKPLQEHGAKMYVVAIGDRPDVNELLPIVREERFVIKIPSFNDLPGMALQVAQTLGNQSGESYSFFKLIYKSKLNLKFSCTLRMPVNISLCEDCNLLSYVSRCNDRI